MRGPGGGRPTARPGKEMSWVGTYMELDGKKNGVIYGLMLYVIGRGIISIRMTSRTA